MPRPRTLDAHPREFFALTEDLLVTPARIIPCGEGKVGARRAQALRAGMYHFWAKLRQAVEDEGFRPDKLETIALALRASGKLPDHADGALVRAMFRIAANTALSIDCLEGSPAQWSVRFLSKSETSVASLIADSLAAPPDLGDGGAALLSELERASSKLD